MRPAGQGGAAPATLAASPLRSEAANAAEEVLVWLVLIKVRFLSPPYSNCSGDTCLTDVGTEGTTFNIYGDVVTDEMTTEGVRVAKLAFEGIGARTEREES